MKLGYQSVVSLLKGLSRVVSPFPSASQTLSASEQNYAQVALSLIFWVKKFHSYLQVAFEVQTARWRVRPFSTSLNWRACHAVTTMQLRAATQADASLGKILRFKKERWPRMALQPWVWLLAGTPIDFVGLSGRHVSGGCLCPFKVARDTHHEGPTAVKTIEILRTIFSVFSLLEQVVTDNGPQFVSQDFAMFIKSTGIKHICSIPYHPVGRTL